MHSLSTYITREFYFIMQDLIRVHGWKQIEPPVLAQNPASAKATLLDLFGEAPEVILFWETYELCIDVMPAVVDLGCRACMFADDLHLLWGCESMRDAKLLGLSLCDPILSPYAYVFDEFFPELRGRKSVVWTPHSASPDFVLPFNERPENVILLSGAIGEPIYPLRCRMRDLEEAGRYPIVLQKHPGYREGYDYDHDPTIGVGYARNIHRCKAAFTDALTFRYVVAKHFEIPATGALLVADGIVSPQLEQLGFIENVHYIPVSAENLEERIVYVLDPGNSEEIDAIRRRGQELVLSVHKSSDRARLIDRACTANLPSVQ